MIISEEEAKKIHFVLVDFFEKDGDPISPPGVKNEALLSSALHRPWTSLGGVEKYRTNDMKAAALLHSMVQNHPFHNGNKRTALVTCLLFYDKLGATIDADENDFYNFMLSIARGCIDNIKEKENPEEFLRKISKWLRAHKTVFLKSFGDIKVMDFVRNCERLGATIKEDDCYLISANNDSVRIAKSTRRFKSTVAKRYLRILGLSERNLGIKFEEFLAGGYSDDNSFKKIIPLLRKLANN